MTPHESLGEPAVTPPGGGEVVGDAPDRRVEILCELDGLHATWSRFGPRREGADLHVHRRHADLFYVLEGELTLMLGLEREAVSLPAGALALMPPLVAHGFRNAGDTEVRYLNFHAPGQGFADFMRALRDGRTLAYDQEPPPAEGVRPASEAMISADGERTVDRPNFRTTVLAEVEQIMVAETWAAPGAAPSEPRGRPDHAESLYVLAGELGLTAGDRELRAGAGSWVQVPAGVPHTVSPSDSPVSYLSIRTPSALSSPRERP